MKLRLCAMLVAAIIAGCGGSGTTPMQSMPVQSSAVATASVESTIVVPGGLVAQNGARAAQYVSASTLGLKVIVTDVPPTGGTASFTATTSVYALGIGLNKVVVPTPATAAGHTETLTYSIYNLAPVAGAIPANGKALAWGITTGYVVLPGANTNNVVLSAIADSFSAPIAETGAFGMMSASPPVLAGAQTALGFGGNTPANGIATLFDAGGNNITTAAGGPYAIVGALPTVATTVATGVPVTIAESAGTCGAIGTGPHLKLSYNGGAAAITAAIAATTGALAAQYDGNGGVGWSAAVSAKAQNQTLTYTLASLGGTSTSSDYNCANQTLSFSQSNETALVTIVEKTSATPYTITVPATTNCTQLVNVYAGNSTAPANLIPYGAPTSLGAGSTFTFQLIPAPPAAASCAVKIQDANAAATGGAAFPGATTYVTALLPPTAVSIIVP